MLQEKWDEGDQLNRMDPMLDAARGPVAVPEPGLAPELAGEIDADAWFAQREPMIARFQERRKTLLEEVDEIDRRLEILGVGDKPRHRAFIDDMPATPLRTRRTAKKPAKPLLEKMRKAAAKPPAAAKGKAGDKASQVVGVMSKTPEKVSEIGERLGLNYSTTWRALELAKNRGLVRSSGIKGKDMRWSLT